MTVIRFESAFVDLYSREALVAEVIDCLSDRRFYLKGISILPYSVYGQAVQADLILCWGRGDREACKILIRHHLQPQVRSRWSLNGICAWSNIND